MLKKIPDTLVIIFIVLVSFSLLTWIIPAGEFSRQMKNGREIVIPGSYHEVHANPQTIADLLKAPVKGFNQSALVVAFVLFVGGVFGVINKTGAIESGLKGLLNFTANKPYLKRAIIPIMVIIFAITGATFGLSEEVLVFILITIPLFISLGYDSILGVAVPLVGTAIGFGGAVTNPFTIGIAQGIAELPMFSGWEYRAFCLFVLTSVTVIYLDRYAQKISKNSALSPVFDLDKQRVDEYKDKEKEDFDTVKKIVLSLFALTIVLLIVGATAWDWYIYEISALFLGLAISVAIVCRMGSQTLIDSFMSGAKEMLSASLVIAFSKGIIIIATEGKIIDTILYAISHSIEDFPLLASAEIMFGVQSLINVIVPSGSGQAALTMPIMAPLCDIIGLTRQTGVLIFQMGDGLNNMIIPTSGVTMGTLAIARIPYDVWVKWLAPLMIIFVIVAMLLLIPPVVLFHFGPR